MIISFGRVKAGGQTHWDTLGPQPVRQKERGGRKTPDPPVPSPHQESHNLQLR